MFLDRHYGIDLGGGAVKVYSLSRNRIVTARNMVAYRGHTIIAVGNEAYEMSGKTPADVSVISPMAFGVIDNLELQEILLYRLIGRLENLALPADYYFAIPPDLSAMDRRAFYQVVNGNWLRRGRVFLVEAPVADALSLGLDIENTVGSMIVNIGEQTARLSIFSRGRMIMNRMEPIGGGQINAAIAHEIRRRYSLQVGTRTANRLKLALGRLSDPKKDGRRVVGLDSVSGLPREETITSYAVNAGIMNCMNSLAAQIKTFLERIPPQISYEIAKEGIHLAGGSARIPYLDKYLASYTGYTFNLSESYENITVEGLKKILHENELKKWAQTVRPRKI